MQIHLVSWLIGSGLFSHWWHKSNSLFIPVLSLFFLPSFPPPMLSPHSPLSLSFSLHQHWFLICCRFVTFILLYSVSLITNLKHGCKNIYLLWNRFREDIVDKFYFRSCSKLSQRWLWLTWQHCPLLFQKEPGSDTGSGHCWFRLRDGAWFPRKPGESAST